MIRRTKCKRKFKFWILHVVRVAESMITILSLGFLNSDFYAAVLFSDWAEDIDEGKDSLV